MVAGFRKMLRNRAGAAEIPRDHWPSPRHSGVAPFGGQTLAAPRCQERHRPRPRGRSRSRALGPLPGPPAFFGDRPVPVTIRARITKPAPPSLPPVRCVAAVAYPEDRPGTSPVISAKAGIQSASKPAAYSEAENL